VFKQQFLKTFALLFFALGAIFPFSAEASTLSLNPASGSYSIGATFSVTVNLNTAGAPVSGADLRYINYNPALLRVNSVTAGTLFGQTVVNSTDTTAGRINFGQSANTGSTYTGSGTLATISFTTLAAGTANITFDYTAGATTDTNIANEGVDTLTQVTGATITIVGAPVDNTPPTISNVSAANITTSGARISWVTNESTTGVIEYGLTSSYGSQVIDPSLSTIHSNNITGLSHSTTYHYRIRAIDESGNTTNTSDGIFTTAQALDTQAPNQITNLTAQNVTQYSMDLVWTAPSDVPSGNVSSYDVRYNTTGLSEANWASATQPTGEPIPATAGTSHLYTLVGLTPGATYYIGIKSIDARGNVSTLSNVVTRATQAPTVTFNYSVAGPATLSVIQGQNTTGQVSATTLAGTPSSVSFTASGLPNGAIATFSPTACTPSTVCTSTMTLATQASTPPGTYTITITGSNAVGGRSATATFTVNPIPPVPTVNLFINGLTSAVVTSGSTATLSWTVANASSCSAGGSWTGSKSFTGGSETTSTITSARTYTLTCTGTGGQNSASVSVSLQGTPPPATPVISNVQVTNISSSAATVTWTSSIPTSSQVEYGTTVSYGTVSPLVGTLSTSHSVTISNLSRRTTYNVRARGTSVDGVQGLSSNTTFTTLARLPKPPKVENVSATLGSVILNWRNPPGYEFHAGTAIIKQTGGYATTYTSSLEIGRTTSTTYTDVNTVPGTTYYYSLFAYDDQGVYADPEFISITIPSTTGGTGSTGGTSGSGGSGGAPAAVDTIPPTAPALLRVLGGPEGIYLQWQNSTAPDFVRTIVVRKEGSVPTSRTDGIVVYEGTATQFTDATTITGRTYYYALFSFDTSSNYSTSASASTARGTLTEAQIQAQLSTVANSPTAPTTPTTPTIPCTPTSGTGIGLALTRGLSRGSTGNDVLLLQRFLNANGFVISASGVGSPGNESTYFGPATEAAVKRFQCARGVTCSGEGYGLVGPRTRAALAQGGAASCVPTTPTTPTTPTAPGSVKVTITRPLYLNVSGEDVRQLQRFLNANGFTVATSGAGSSGNETTFFGPATERAVQKYQCARGIICSGYGYGSVGPKTRAQLNVE
jgi:hypothetical protein